MSQDTIIIANTIKQQIGTNTLMCIGAHMLMMVPKSEKNLGGLTFKLGRNPKMKQGGRVTVTLDFNDTYSVKVETSRGKVTLDASNVYAEDLAGQHGVIEQVTG